MAHLIQYHNPVSVSPLVTPFAPYILGSEQQSEVPGKLGWRSDALL